MLIKINRLRYFFIVARFWGWRENGAELKRWEEEASTRGSEVKKGWEDNDWVSVLLKMGIECFSHEGDNTLRWY
jgi:hypothetical protein